jgi:FkbM family methyltransferase
VYSLKHKAISWVSKNLFDDVTYTVRNGLNKGLRRRGGLGWVPFESSNTPEFQFWKALDLRGQVVYDIGAFHGLLTLYFARNAKQVTAWEPNSHNRRRLAENLKLNSFSNVTVRPYGLSSRSMQAQMSFDSLVPGTASVDTGLARGGEYETIELRTLDQEQGLEPPSLIKIDVEGFELEVLKGASRTLTSATSADRRPRLFLEMHGVDQADKRKRVRAIVEHLWELGYRDILHIESRTRIAPENTEIAAQGHLYAQAG